jgi:hypothetical protein
VQRIELREYILQNFAKSAGCTVEQITEADMTLAEVISQSPVMTNSIDLMEAFAKTSNSLRKEYGVRVRLPALPLDTPISTVLEIFLDEYARQESKEVVA